MTSASTKLLRRTLLGSLGVMTCSRDARVDAPPPASAAIPRRPLGRTGVSVSIVGIGGYHIGIPKDEAEAIRIVQTALDRGINFLDNCWDYHEGKSEERMGKALAGGYRHQAFLMTKIDGRTAKAATGQLEQSLRRLQTDVIDLVQVHEVIRDTDPARAFAEDGCIGGLVAAKKAGKLRYIGFTGHKDPAIHLAMLDAAEAHGFAFDAVQMPLNVMDAHFRSFEKLVLPRLVASRTGVLGMKALGDGRILKSNTASAIECLHYAMHLETSVVITGCERMADLKQAVEAATSFQPLTDAQRQELLARTREASRDGKYEVFKTTDKHDGTSKHPEWLESA